MSEYDNNHKNDNTEKHRFYKKSFFMPFGIFNTDKTASGRAAEVLIGRNNERASFIRRLLNAGKGGAYLITGQRGTGKTSFVEHCMKMYEQDKVQRFANSGLAKSVPDIFATIFFIFALITFPVVVAVFVHFTERTTLVTLMLEMPLYLLVIIGLTYTFSPLQTIAKLILEGRKNRKKYLPLAKKLKAENKANVIESTQKKKENRAELKSKILTYIVFSGLSCLAVSLVNSHLITETLIFLASFSFVNIVLFLLCKSPNLHDANSQTTIAKLSKVSATEYFLVFLTIIKTGASLMYFSLIFVLASRFGGSWFEGAKGIEGGEETFAFIFLAVLLLIALVLYLENRLVVQPSQCFIRNRILREDHEAVLPLCFSHLALLNRKEVTQNKAETITKINHTTYKGRIIFKQTYRELLKSCWLAGYLGVWKPILKIKINLGFDGLEHANIVYGLLKQIHKQYVEAFIKLANIRVALTKAFIFVIFTWLALHAGDGLFAFKDRGEAQDFPMGEKIATARVYGSELIPQLFGFQLYLIESLKKQTNNEKSSEPADSHNQDALTDNFKPYFIAIKTNSISIKTCGLNCQTCRLSPQSPNCLKNNVLMDNSNYFYLLYADLVTAKIKKTNDSQSTADTKKQTIYPKILEWFMSPQVFPFINTHYSLSNNFITSKNIQKDKSNEITPKNIQKNKSNEIIPIGNLKDELNHLSPKYVVAMSEQNQQEMLYSVKAFHIYLFVLIALLYTLVDKIVPILPYRANDRNLRTVIDRLTATKTADSGIEAGGLISLPFIEKKTYKPLDSRDIEQHFLDVLASLSSPKEGLVNRFLSVPSPDITIIFDELDKLGSSGKEQKKTAENKEQKSVRDAFELTRSSKIKELLSDLKNVIDSQHCRFILIGGRHLRDEWLADQTKRDQLLPSIFDKSIYLPSLITDSPRLENRVADDLLIERIKEYFIQQHVRANWLFDKRNKGGLRELLLKDIDKNRDSQTYASQHLLDSRKSLFFEHTHYENSSAICLYDKNLIKKGTEIRNTILNTFIKYIAYRSQGIPKRLNEVFASTVMPFNRIFKSSCYPIRGDQRKHLLLLCRDALLFDDTNLYRMQFTARLYDMIESLLGRKLYARDDKIVTAVFYITDFLLKFHTRAFDWNGLEKIDDIADINRAPDLRGLIYEIVEGFSETLLHPVLNGMYAYRFKSSSSRELIYMSKISPTESAAFNFTLDESQALKEIYARKLESSAGITSEISASLGELHEYDQDYDAARKEYYNTIQLIDGKVEQLLDIKKESENGNYYSHMKIIKEMEETKGKGIGLSLSFVVDWAIFRVRLMLKIAMTYEHTRNYERAAAYYHESHMLSRRLLQLVISETPTINEFILKPKAKEFEEKREKYSEMSQSEQKDFLSSFNDKPNNGNFVTNTLFSAKNFHILYQSAFAKAWLMEKQGTAVDASTVILIEELRYFESLFDHFRLCVPIETYLTQSDNGKLNHASLALIKAEFYNKVGDMCFFKGLNLPDITSISRYNHSIDDNHFSGFLYKASHFYACGLHYLRHFNIYRHESSKRKHSVNVFSSIGAGIDAKATFSAEQLPDNVLVASASSLADISEVILARVNIKLLIESLASDTKTANLGDKDIKVQFDLNDEDESLKEKCENLFRNFMITSSIFFDKWLKYSDEGDSSYIKAANKHKKKWYKEFNLKFSLWKEAGTSNEQLIKEEEFIEYWFGVAERDKSVVDNGHSSKIVSSKGTTDCSIERIICYASLIDLSTTYLKQAGHIEEAAYELRRAATSITSLLEMIVLLKTQATFNHNNLQLKNVNWNNEKIETFVKFLIEQGIYFIERSASLYRGRSAKKGSHKVQVGDDISKHISSKLILAAIRLCLTAIKLANIWENIDFIKVLRVSFQGYVKGSDKVDHQYSLEQLIMMADKRYGYDKDRHRILKWLFKRRFDQSGYTSKINMQLTLSIKGFIEILRERCLMKRFPILNRLEMLEQLSLAISQPRSINPKLLTLSILAELRGYFKHKCTKKAQQLDIDNRARKISQYLYEQESNLRLTSIMNLDKFKIAIIKSNPIARINNIEDVLAVLKEVADQQNQQDQQMQPKIKLRLEQAIEIMLHCYYSSDMNSFYDMKLLGEAIDFTEEMLEIEEQYDSPFHFSPVQAAHTCFRLADTLERTTRIIDVNILVAKNCDPEDYTNWLKTNKNLLNAETNKLKSDTDKFNVAIDYLKQTKNERLKKAKYFYIRANNYFYRSQQMYTMRREYYKTISNMYYLYDDFNDRYIHHNKAIHMLGSTISISVEKEISRRLLLLDQIEL